MTPARAASVRTGALWLGLLGPAAAWMAHLAAGYAVRAVDCGPGSVALVHAASIVALGMVALAGRAAWRSWSSLRADPASAAHHRERFMAAGGIVLAVFFSGIIIAAWVGTLATGSCAEPM